MKLIFVGVLVLLLTGCATDGYNPITGQTTQPGTYTFDVTDEGVHVEAATLKGGPDVSYSKTPDGAISIKVSPSQTLIVETLGEMLK